MPSVVKLLKVSGVIFITEDSLNPKSFFGAVGNYQFSSDDTTVMITIGNYQVSVAYTGLRVGASEQTPASVSTAKVLLNAFFGS